MSESRRIRVNLPGRAYDVVVGAGIMDRPDSFSDKLPGRDVMIVTNDTVGPLYAERLRLALGSRRVEACSLPDGEEYKTLETFSRVIDALVAARMHRDATIVGLGGGVVGDIAGFAAACYQRGVAVVQAPTTLLAQVDAAIGGKTGVNHPAGKNLIGAFHQPAMVLADVGTLDTLPEREYLAGMAEVVKYGAGLDTVFFEWLEGNVEALLARQRAALIEAVARCCEFKARIVEQDEREAGRRALLNLGHTFGHAFEAATGFRQWLHGEAVAVGIHMAARLSARMGHLDMAQADRIAGLLRRFGLPLNPPPGPPSTFVGLMGVDKKVLAGKLRFVLLSAIGDSFVTAEVSEADVIAVLAEATAG